MSREKIKTSSQHREDVFFVAIKGNLTRFNLQFSGLGLFNFRQADG